MCFTTMMSLNIQNIYSAIFCLGSMSRESKVCLPNVSIVVRSTILFLATKLIEIDSKKQKYEGEIDQEGNACGVGSVVYKRNDTTVKFEGTFFNDKQHGLCK